MGMTPNIETEGLLSEIYRDIRKILVGAFGILFYLPKAAIGRIRCKRELRKHRINYENADIDKIWRNAKPSIKRRLTNDERFLYRTVTHPPTAVGYGLVMTNAQVKLNMSENIIHALDTVKSSKSMEADGRFVLHIEMDVSSIDPEHFEDLRAIVVDEISRVFNSHFELDLLTKK